MELEKLNFKSSSMSPIEHSSYHALRSLTQGGSEFKQGDVLVLFGELFQRGYANGLVEAAIKKGMKVIYSTVGRREGKTLRALNGEELAAAPSPIINVPLEAGFDLEPDSSGTAPVDQLAGAGLKNWEETKLNWDSIENSRMLGRKRFTGFVDQYLEQLAPHIPSGANVLMAHLMAGGVPRTKIVMPIMNRVFKGTGDRYYSSEKFWDSEIGRFCALSFFEVTADTFDIFVDRSTALREKIQKNGGRVVYTAYGYHGTEVYFDGAYRWQSYTPYVQGFAKKRLEDHARAWTKKGVTCTVYNCPEILTNSSSIFQGVEIPLYPLLKSLKKEGGDHPEVQKVIKDCATLLKPECRLEELAQLCEDQLVSKEVQEKCMYEQWPQHNTQVQMERVLKTSDAIFDMHISTKNLVTSVLSEVVFVGCGRAMLADSISPKASVSWLNHDLLSRLHIS